MARPNSDLNSELSYCGCSDLNGWNHWSCCEGLKSTWAEQSQCSVCHLGDLTIILRSSSLASLSPKPTSKSTLLRDLVVLNVLPGRPPTVVFPGPVSSCGSKGRLQLWPQGRTPGVLPEEASLMDLGRNQPCRHLGLEFPTSRRNVWESHQLRFICIATLENEHRPSSKEMAPQRNTIPWNQLASFILRTSLQDVATGIPRIWRSNQGGTAQSTRAWYPLKKKKKCVVPTIPWVFIPWQASRCWKFHQVMDTGSS